jgi:signal transduction histidine kinase
MGLTNVRIRMASFGGTINIASRAGEGTEVNGEIQLRINNYESGNDI